MDSFCIANAVHLSNLKDRCEYLTAKIWNVKGNVNSGRKLKKRSVFTDIWYIDRIERTRNRLRNLEPYNTCPNNSSTFFILKSYILLKKLDKRNLTKDNSEEYFLQIYRETLSIRIYLFRKLK